jgi:hypothetical protein
MVRQPETVKEPLVGAGAEVAATHAPEMMIGVQVGREEKVGISILEENRNMMAGFLPFSK